MPELEKQFQKRQVAFKVKISDILNSDFDKDEFLAGYIKLNGVHISRVNVIGTVVYHQAWQNSNFDSIIIDDGTGKIMLRVFEKSNMFSKIEVGDAALVIGKIREFNNERYLAPEILKKLSNISWLNARRLELEKSKPLEVEKNFTKENKKSSVSELAQTANEQIYLLVKKLDSGDGAAIEDVIKDSGTGNAEEIISRLLENGDVFEIRPGRLKVLE